MKPSTKQQKFQKLFPLPFVIISICLIANLRDFSSIEDSGLPAFRSVNLGAWSWWCPRFMDVFWYSTTRGIYATKWRVIKGLDRWCRNLAIAIFMMIFSLAFHFSIGVEKVQNSVVFLFGLFSSLKRNGEKTIEDKVTRQFLKKIKILKNPHPFGKKYFLIKKTEAKMPCLVISLVRVHEFKEPLQSSTGSSHLKKLKSPKIDKVELKEENAEPLTNLEEPPASPSKKKELDVGKLRNQFFWTTASKW